MGLPIRSKQISQCRTFCSGPDWVIRNEIDVIRHQLRRNGVELWEADAMFVDAHTIRLTTGDGQAQREVTADKVIIACGTKSTRDPSIPFDGQRVFTSDEILELEHLSKTIAIIGGGVIGCDGVVAGVVHACLSEASPATSPRYHLCAIDIVESMIDLMAGIKFGDLAIGK